LKYPPPSGPPLGVQVYFLRNPTLVKKCTFLQGWVLSGNVSAYTYYSYRRNVQELLTRHHLDLKMALLSRPLCLSQESDENDRGSFGISEEWSF